MRYTQELNNLLDNVKAFLLHNSNKLKIATIVEVEYTLPNKPKIKKRKAVRIEFEHKIGTKLAKALHLRFKVWELEDNKALILPHEI